jgi:cbb3-type cytochrome c oxidase subunit III
MRINRDAPRVKAALPAAYAVAALLAVAYGVAEAQERQVARTGRQVYESTCATCHGPNGRGGVNPGLEAVVKPPDFADCGFANREPDRGFVAVAHGGGPARGFSPLMPSWAASFTEEELEQAVAYLRTFCADQRWPRGELNLPRPLVTAKAFPEDEAVVSTAAQSGGVVTKFIYERRFGPLNQVEVILPLSSAKHATADGYSTGIGDVALEYKRVLAHSHARGNIISVTGELLLPTGNEDKALGGGTAVFEPFLTYGQRLPRDGFLQAQAGVGLPLSSGHDNELFWRAAVGKTFEYPRFGREWSPMLEILAARPLVSGAGVEWDLVPGAQVTLSARQHVRVAAGVRLPVTDAAQRSKTALVYLLWDWYEGGFLQGW